MITIVIAAVLLPMAAGLCCLFLKKLSAGGLKALVTAAAVAELALVAAVAVWGQDASLSLPMVLEMDFALRVDGLGRFFGLLVGFVWLMVTIYSFPYMAHEGSEGRFFGFFLCTLGAVIGVGYAGNILSLYLFFELMTFASAPMVMHNLKKENKQAAGAYLVYSVLGATLGLFCAVYLSGPGATGNTAIAMTVLAVVGFCCKAGLAPFHVWLPLAHPIAPAPASAVLSGIITKCGVVAAIRVLYGIVDVQLIKGSWGQTTLVVMALCTILLGSTLAYSENGLKKRLAYSSVSQLSYLLLGVFLMTSAGLMGALLQMVFHALAKVTLFLCAGAIILLLHRHRADELDGVGKKLPVVMGCFAAASLSLVGIPPLGGAVSKWNLAVAGLTSDLGVLRYLIPVTLLVSALLTAGYLFSVVQNAFYKEPDTHLAAAAIKTPLAISLPLVALCAGLLLFGLFPAPLTNLLDGVIRTLII